MPTDSKSKKSLSSTNESPQSNIQPDPDGFLAELNDWGSKPNPASFEKLLETHQQKFARALEQGYRAEDICRLAADYGIQVKASTFRKYWQKLKSQNSSEPTAVTSTQSTPRQATPKQETKPVSTASTSDKSAVNF